MRVFDFDHKQADPILEFNSTQAGSVPLGNGTGESHIYAVHFGPHGIIGNHPTGFCQLFLVVQGAGWVSVEGEGRVHLSAGQGAFFDRGENHSKGSDNGMTAIMVQASKMAIPNGR